MIYDNDCKADWTDERVKSLKKLWNEGISASEIATELGHTTPSAVIGKAHRLGLPSRENRKQNGEKQHIPKKRIRARQMAREGQNTRPQTPDPPEPDTDEVDMSVFEKTASGTRCSLIELTDDHCRWPIGDVGDKDFHFCGEKAEENRPYCSYHARIAYKPVVAPQRRKREVV